MRFWRGIVPNALSVSCGHASTHRFVWKNHDVPRARAYPKSALGVKVFMGNYLGNNLGSLYAIFARNSSMAYINIWIYIYIPYKFPINSLLIP